MGNVLRTLEVCEAVSVHQPIGVRELAREIEMPKSTVQRALDTLHAAGWVVRSDAGRWSRNPAAPPVGRVRTWSTRSRTLRPLPPLRRLFRDACAWHPPLVGTQLFPGPLWAMQRRNASSELPAAFLAEPDA